MIVSDWSRCNRPSGGRLPIDIANTIGIIILIMLLQTSTPTISAMELRKEPGRFLDRVDLRRETFIVERAGKPKAALVPLTDLQEMVRMKAEARQAFFAMTDEIGRNFTKSGLSEKQLEALIDTAVTAVRKEQSASKPNENRY